MNQSQEYLIPEIPSEEGQGPAWLRDLRNSARQSFNASPLPQRGLHLWRYTDPASFVFPRPVPHSESVDAQARTDRPGHAGAHASDFAGRVIKCRPQNHADQTGMIITPLSTAVESHRAVVEQHLYQLVNQQSGKFEAMNGALWSDGIFVYVPDNTVISEPIHLLREAGGALSAQFPRLLVVVGRNAELTLIDEYVGGSADAARGVSYSNGCVEIFGSPDSRVRYVSLQRQEPAMHTFLTMRARIEKGASMLTVPLVFGASITKQNFGVILNGLGAQSDMYGMVFGSERCHFDNHTLHHHASGHTRSNINFKVILRDKSVSAYTGLIRIDHNAQVCEAYQENRNLLLNAGARAESIPELEILNEEVMCSHGATVGPIDPMSLFYLTSRGISRRDAVRMIVSGFVNPTLELVPADLRGQISEIVAHRLESI